MRVTLILPPPFRKFKPGERIVLNNNAFRGPNLCGIVLTNRPEPDGNECRMSIGVLGPDEKEEKEWRFEYGGSRHTTNGEEDAIFLHTMARLVAGKRGCWINAGRITNKVVIKAEHHTAFTLRMTSEAYYMSLVYSADIVRRVAMWSGELTGYLLWMD